MFLILFRYFVSVAWIVPLSIYAESFEPRLIDSLNALQYKSDSVSESKISALISDYPNSQTAHLMMADLLAARAGVIDPYTLREKYPESTSLRQLDGLRDEMRLRWNQTTTTGPAEKGLIPASIIQLAPNRNTVVVVDAANARLYTYKNSEGKLSLAMNNYTTIGKKGNHKRLEGDEKTPIGVYHVTRFIADKDLPPLYGSGAFPINYPNQHDKRMGRTGFGIWLHGTHPESFNRVPLASDGCVAMSNSEFDLLKPLIQPKSKTAVIISDQLSWVSPEHLDVTRNYFNGLLQKWVADWESRDPERYLSHYSKSEFISGNSDYNSWAAQKTAVNASKSKIDIELSNISLFAYPGERDLIVAEFTQNYRSNNFDSESDKRQYWRRDINGDWKITFEGPQ
jgi:murein L,D-transpeptidase YafK